MGNPFADMGVQPQTLQASLVIASQSMDKTPPTSTISTVSSRNVVEGQTVTVSGTATDVGGGVIGAVQVSSDGGATWHPASGQVGSGSMNWTYSFTAPAPGTHTIESRAVDDSLNLETPGTGVSYTVTPSTAISLFGSSIIPPIANDPNAVEVGVKFTAATSGLISGIRFYKGSTNTGTHVGDLWSASGALLATVTFTNETASGWQQASFASPVSISAGTTYIASFHTNTGNYADTPYYFATYQGQSDGSLNAPGDSLNGVFAYSANSTFPNNVSTDTADNYWVDIVFNDSGHLPPVLSNVAASASYTAGATATTLSSGTTDSDPGGSTTLVSGTVSISSGLFAGDVLAASTSGTNVTASYSASTGVMSLTGADTLAHYQQVLDSVSYSSSSQNPTNFGADPSRTVSWVVNDGTVNSATQTTTINITGGPATASLFSASNTPAQTNQNDGSPLEVGVKFQSSVAVQITALKFYRSPSDSGSDVLDLWMANGTKLASATFTNTAASGWQTVTLTTPAAISANTTYVASYHTSGFYVETDNFFTTAFTSGVLTAPSTTTAGGNGVYAYGGTSTTGIFPTNTFSAANYWADVVYYQPTSISVIIAGTAQEGQTLTANPSGAVTGYQWQSFIGGTWTNISGATSSTYVVQETNEGNQLRVHVTSSGGSRSEEHTSELQSLRHLVCRLL